MLDKNEIKTIKMIWACIILIVVAVIFVMSHQNTAVPERMGDPLADHRIIEQTDLIMSSFDQRVLIGLTLEKLVHMFLFCILSFCMHELLNGWKYSVLFSFGFSFLCAIFDELHRHLVGRFVSWQDMLADLIGILIGTCLALLLPVFNKLLKKWFYHGLNQSPKKKKLLNNCLDALSLGSVIHYAAFRFLQQSTMLPLIYSERYKIVTLLLLAVFGGVRFAYLFLHRLWSIEDKKRQAETVVKACFIACLAIPFFYAGLIYDLKALVYLPFAVLCLYDMGEEKIFRWFVLVIGILFSATVLCCFAGIIPNVFRSVKNSFEGSYGFINTTDFAAYFLFLLLFAWCSIKKRTPFTYILFSFVAVGIALFSRHISGSRTTMICCFLLAFVCLYELLFNNLPNRFHRMKWIAKTVDQLAICSFPLAMISFYGLCYLYRHGYPLAVQANTLLSDRLRITLNLFDKYGLSLLGTSDIMHGFGRSIFGISLEYDFPDASYAFLIFRYGIMITLIITCLWVFIAVRAIKNGKKSIAYVMVIICVYAFSESHFVDINYNFLLLMPFCAFSSLKESKENSVAKSKTASWFSWIPVILIFVGYCVAAPQMLSCLRTLFFLRKWNSGMTTGYAFLVCTSIPVSICLIWKLTSLLRYDRPKAAAAAFILIVFAFVFGCHAMNQEIEDGIEKHSDEILSEKETIDLILSSASQPVYALEKSELYQRRIGGLSGFVCSVEDFCRNKEGTLLTDKSTERLALIMYGAKYLQFSDTSGVYSFDPAMIDSLTSKGFKWKNYYDSERICDLKDLAQLNSLRWTREGEAVLEGPTHSLTRNRPVDLYYGVYEVRYSLRLSPEAFDEISDETVCTIRVTAFDGEQLILEKEISKNDFNPDGICTATIYHDGFISRAEYLLYINQDITMYLDEIAWRAL